MTRFAAAVAILGVALGCASPAPASPDPASEIALHVGEKAQVQGGELVVTFVGVTQDSRCPKGEQCITAGCNDYVVKPADNRQLITLILRHLAEASARQNPGGAT